MTNALYTTRRWRTSCPLKISSPQFSQHFYIRIMNIWAEKKFKFSKNNAYSWSHLPYTRSSATENWLPTWFPTLISAPTNEGQLDKLQKPYLPSISKGESSSAFEHCKLKMQLGIWVSAHHNGEILNICDWNWISRYQISIYLFVPSHCSQIFQPWYSHPELLVNSVMVWSKFKRCLLSSDSLDFQQAPNWPKDEGTLNAAHMPHFWSSNLLISIKFSRLTQPYSTSGGVDWVISM